LITATLGQPVQLPDARDVSGLVQVVHEDGSVADLPTQRTRDEITVSSIAMSGYHQIEFGERRATLAVAPAKCVTIADLGPGERIWGLAAQLYGLRSVGDCGIGDMAGVSGLAKAAADLTADALALSPTHALFTADPAHFSPYSPSNRLFYNPLHADPAAIFGEATIAKARNDAGVAAEAVDLERADLVDWPPSSRVKLTMFRRLFHHFYVNHLSALPAQ
jgi:4-alpha-glucanotransferase